MKVHKIYKSRKMGRQNGLATVRVKDDIVALKIEDSSLKLLLSDGMFYAIGVDGQPRRIDATEEKIDEAMANFGLYHDPPKKVSDEEHEEAEEPVEKKRPYVKRK